jgi:hypothetical protein
MSATRLACDPNDRTPMTGLAGLTFTSATGARSWLMPIAASSRPVIAPALRASATSRVAPSAMLPGNCVAGGPTRTTDPFSWSVLMNAGMAEC